MNWSNTIATDKSQKIPEKWLLIHYYEALNLLFRIENSLRVFVYIILKNHLGEKWHDASAISDDSEAGTIKVIARRRMSQTNNFGYLGYPTTCPMLYLTTGELIGIIMSNTYWKYFAKYFPGSKEVIKNKFDEISSIRNALAHFRPLPSDDIEVIKQNAKHVVSQVEKFIKDITLIRNSVPSNAEDEWYVNIKQLEANASGPSISFHQSEEDKSWIQITCRYIPKKIRTTRYGDSQYIRLLTLKTPAILSDFEILRNTCIYCSEFSYGSSQEIADDAQAPQFTKYVKFTMSRNKLSQEHIAIKAELERLIALIKEEELLLQKDNRAHGSIVEIVNVNLKGYVVDYSAMNSPVKPNDPPEYWGEIGFDRTNFISDTIRYPWMAADISNPVELNDIVF